jgi:competence protein ComEC
MIPAQQVRRPLVGIALSVAAGLTLQRGIGGSPLLLLSVIALLLALVCRTVMSRPAAPLIYIVCGLLAAAYGAVEGMPSVSRAALASAEVLFREQELTGTIKDDPSVSEADETLSFLFRVSSVLYAGNPIPSDAVLKVYLKDSSEPIRFGEQWTLRGRYTGYEKPRGGAVGFLSVPENSAVRIRPAGVSLVRSCYSVRRRAADILRAGIEPFADQSHLLHALLLGYRQAMPPELYRLFSRTGVLHIFAISGLHVGMMAAILIAMLKLAGISRPRWGWLLIPALFLFVTATGMKASALRAFTMAAVYFAAPLAGRRPDASSAIALAAILLLIINPAHISDPGFLLSFVVVCGLLMVHGWVTRQVSGVRFSGWREPLKQLNGPHPAAVILRAAGLLAVTSLAAWIFSAPITACFFNTLSPAALIGNPVVIPLTFMIMLAGCLALLSGALFLPAAAVLFNQANLVLISLLIWAVRHLAALPGACRAVRAPSALIAGLWYAGLVLFFTGPARWRKGALLALLLSAVWWGAGPLEFSRDIKVLREGSSAVALRLPENRWVLVTDGSSFSSTRTIRLLQREGVNRLYALVVSDEQADVAAVQRLQETFSPQQTLYGNEMCWPAGGGVVSTSRNR